MHNSYITIHTHISIHTIKANALNHSKSAQIQTHICFAHKQARTNYYHLFSAECYPNCFGKCPMVIKTNLEPVVYIKPLR